MRKQMKYAVVLYVLESHDPGYDRGARYRLDDVQGDQFHFRTKKAAQSFLGLHGLTQIDEPDMIEIRNCALGRTSKRIKRLRRREGGRDQGPGDSPQET